MVMHVSNIMTPFQMTAWQFRMYNGGGGGGGMRQKNETLTSPTSRKGTTNVLGTPSYTVCAEWHRFHIQTTYLQAA